jgi:putative nucleotidyltransferase with HDIG domain
MGLIAGEMGLDVPTAKRAGLLHDIGKAVSHEVEGAHALLGADLVRRYGESEEVVNAVASHHDEVPHHGPLASCQALMRPARRAGRPLGDDDDLHQTGEASGKIGLSFRGAKNVCRAGGP